MHRVCLFEPIPSNKDSELINAKVATNLEVN